MMEVEALFRAELTKVREQRDTLMRVLNQIRGIHSPFICGESGERGPDGLSERIIVCPAYGADITAVYVRVKKES
jgi:hypothetical protein